MACILDAIFTQAAEQQGNGLSPVLQVNVFATKLTPYDTPTSASPAGTPISGAGSGSLTYTGPSSGQPQSIFAQTFFSGDIPFFSDIFEGAEEPSSGEKGSLSVTIQKFVEGGYSVSLSSDPATISGTSEPLNCLTTAGGLLELTGQFTANATESAAPGKLAGPVPGAAYNVAFSVAMRTYPVRVTLPPPPGV
jgi:hypothetical protein